MAVLLIGFNRPDNTRALIRHLANSTRLPDKVYFAVDGPRPGNEQDLVNTSKVRQLVSEINWPCEIKTLFRSTNKGCKLGVSEAITWMFSYESSGVILEDDCWPTPQFVAFAEELLLRYADDDRIGMVCGFNAYNLQTDAELSYHFEQGLNIWGWATWKRVWQKYNANIDSYSDKIDTIANTYPKELQKKIQAEITNGIRTIQNGCDTWDIQLAIMLLANHYLNIVPRERLTTNNGCEDPRAAHTTCYMYFAKRHYSVPGHIGFPLKHPLQVVIDEYPRKVAEKMERGILNRSSSFLATRFPFLRKTVDMFCATIEKFIPSLFQI